MKILVIDDERPWRTAVEDVLAPSGHEVRKAQDTATGLSMLKSHEFDVVILDKNVPTESDGLGFLEEAERLKMDPRHFSRFSELSIIMLTAYPSFASMKKSFSLNLHDYVEKDDMYIPNLKRNIREIELVRKFNLFSVEKTQVAKLFQIKQLGPYFDKLFRGEISTVPFINSLFGVNALFSLNAICEAAFEKLFFDAGMTDHAPELGRVESQYHRYFSELALEIIKNGRETDISLLKSFIDACLNNGKYFGPDSVSGEWNTDRFIHAYALLVHFDLVVDLIPDDKLRSQVRRDLAEYRLSTNEKFTETVQRQYPAWVAASKKSISFGKPTLSPNAIARFASPFLEGPTCLLVFDGMRLGQWFTIRGEIENELRAYRMTEHLYMAILPTATTFARNSLLSGLFPVDIANRYDSGYLKSNAKELELLRDNFVLKDTVVGYVKRAESRQDDLNRLIEDDRKPFKVFIFNFIDELGHVMHAIGGRDRHFRKHVKAGFKDSVMIRTLKRIAETGCNILITTDHGNIRISKTVRIGNYLTTESRHSRYALVDRKFIGKKNETITVSDPVSFGLPEMGKHNFVFAKGDVKFMGKAKKTEAEFVHGGISMEEMIVPFVVMTPDA